MNSELVLLLLFASLATMLVVEMGRRKRAQVQVRKEKTKANMASLNKQIDDNEAGYSEALSKLDEATDGHGLPLRFVAGERIEAGDMVRLDAVTGKIYRITHTID